MRLQENAIDSCRHSRPCEWLDKLRLAAAGVALAARKLDGMCHVEDHRIPDFLKGREGAHVHNEILVAERRAALGKNNWITAAEVKRVERNFTRGSRSEH